MAKKSWTRIHVDFLGPIDNMYCFVIMDAHSKWIENFVVHGTSSEVAINKLSETFARFGFPRFLTFDGASCCTSAEFQSCLRNLGI